MSKPYCGIGSVPKDSKRGSMKDCAMSGQIRYYGLKKIDPRLVEHTKDAKKGDSSQKSMIQKRAQLKGKINVLTKKYKDEKDPKKKKKINDEYKKVVVELKQLNASLQKMGRISSRKSSRNGSRKGSRTGSRKGSRSSRKHSSRKHSSRKHSSRKHSSRKHSSRKHSSRKHSSRKGYRK